MRRCLLEIMHQDDAFAVLLELLHHRCDDLLGLAHLEVERVHIGRENTEVTLACILQQFRWMPQSRETEERADRLVAESNTYGGNAFFDLIDALLLAQLGQILVRPSVRSNGMTGSRYLLHDF